MKVIQLNNKLIIEHGEIVYTVERGNRYVDKEGNSALCEGFNRIGHNWVVHFRGEERGYQLTVRSLVENYVLPSQFNGTERPKQLNLDFSSKDRLERIEAKLDFLIRVVQ